MRPARLGALLLVALALAGCGASTATAPAPTTPAPRQPTPAARPAAPRALRLLRRADAQGRLPQTRALPSSHTPLFHELMAALWTGVARGRTAPALSAFFPRTAYAQVKAIADPGADWVARLLGGYRLDILAAHALLGSQARAARLLAVDVPAAHAHWVAPGACFNRVGYWEVPNSRVVYSAGGRVRSFGIASMISWRGDWYVVHLGAVTRTGPGGVVNAPAIGRGISQPSSTC